MSTTKSGEFKGEIGNYLLQNQNNFDFKIDRTFSTLKMKTSLCKTRIFKSQGYAASQLLFVLFILPMLKLKTVNSFCAKKWYQWSPAQRDSFYHFKHNPYRWRSFFYKVISEISSRLNFEQVCPQERYFVIEDSVLPKRGKQIENVSFIYDHCLGRSVLGFCIVTLGLFTGKAFYPLDFSYRFGSKRHPKSAQEKIGNPISSSGQRSFEAKHYSKLDLALMMLKRALSQGLNARYVLFDSWYACPYMIRSVRQLNKKLHVICRLKQSKAHYTYHGKNYSLSQLHSKIRNAFRKDKRTGLLLNRVTVRIPGSDQPVTLVFAKGYCEP